MSGQALPVIACLPASETLAPCPAGTAPGAVSAYLLSDTSAAAFEPYNTEVASEFWFASFVLVLSLYIGSRIVGQLVNMTR